MSVTTTLSDSSKAKNQKGIKTPISYYGGKQSMIKDIIPLIPKHNIYVEPFFWWWSDILGKRTVKMRGN